MRFRTPDEGQTGLNDLVRGGVLFENTEFDDFVIRRTDGSPTYNFVVVADDADMKITHVVRGEDHVSNTPKQILIYQALGLAVPAFAHLPLILGTDGSRLSKRHGATSVMAYQEMGYLPDGLNNYLARLGWSHGDQEIFSRGELIEHFSLDHVGSLGRRLQLREARVGELPTPEATVTGAARQRDHAGDRSARLADPGRRSLARAGRRPCCASAPRPSTSWSTPPTTFSRTTSLSTRRRSTSTS